MRSILIIFDDKIFLDFVKAYLSYKNYRVIEATNGVEGIRLGIKEDPDLIIIDKNVTGIELDGFFIKKRINPTLRDIPVFLLGDFNPKEISKFNKENVKAFISLPVNPHALLERLNLYFKINNVEKHTRTPMLVDIHNKGKIIIIQIEGNFEPDKLEILNYQIRYFCKMKKLYSPKIFLIIPSLYPESITSENLNILFKFKSFPELKIYNKHIRILSQCTQLLKLLKTLKPFSDIEIVSNFIEGVQKLNLDIDNKKQISITHLKEGASYIFDLYDDTGMIRIPALTKLTQNMVDYLKKSGEKKLTYYSDINIEDIEEDQDVLSKDTKDTLERMIIEYETIDDKHNVSKDLKDDKMKLFFSKLKNKEMLVVSVNKQNNEVIFNALKPFVNLNFVENGNKLPELDKCQYVSIFLDIELTAPSAMDLLKKIRNYVSRRQTSVIITAKNMNRKTFNLLKNSGTDNILIAPFSTDKVLRKVFESVSGDRST